MTLGVEYDGPTMLRVHADDGIRSQPGRFGRRSRVGWRKLGTPEGLELPLEIAAQRQLIIAGEEGKIIAHGRYDAGNGAPVDPQPMPIPAEWWLGAWVDIGGNVEEPQDPIVDFLHSELRWTSGRPPITRRFMRVFYLVGDLTKLVAARTPAPPTTDDPYEFMQSWPHKTVKQSVAVPECNHVTGATWRKCLDAWHRLPDERKNSGPGRPKGSKNKSSK